MAKFGQGLGINKLFNEASIASIDGTSTVHYISIYDIEGHEKNRKFDSAKLEALALDIEDRGLLAPINVVPIDGERYRALDGHRRLEAFKLLAGEGKSKFEMIPAFIKDGLDDDAAEELLIGGNLFTEPLSPAELARELQRKKELLELRREKGEKIPGKLTEIISAELGIAPQTARELDTINRRAEPEIKELFENGEISQREAFLASRQDKDKQIELAENKKCGAKHLFSAKSTGVVHTPPHNDNSGVAHAPPPEEDPEQMELELPMQRERSYNVTAEEIEIKLDNVSYLCIYGTHRSGNFVCVVNLGVSAELGGDDKYNAKAILKALMNVAYDCVEMLPSGIDLEIAAQHIAKIITAKLEERK